MEFKLGQLIVMLSPLYVNSTARNTELPQNAVFSFKLKVNYFIDCIAIVRRACGADKDGLFELGCEFINMNIDNVKAISLFTFKEQLKKKRQELYDSIFK